MSADRHDSGRAAAGIELSSVATAVLREALRASEYRPLDGNLRPLLQRLTSQARREGLRAEQLIVLLKARWMALPETQRLPYGARRSRVLERVVSLCIEEFYRAPGQDGPAGAPPGASA